MVDQAPEIIEHSVGKRPFDPADHGWDRDSGDRFVGQIGPIWRRMTDSREEFGFVAEEKHLNRNGNVHGGMLVALFDHALGQACYRLVGADAALATIQINTQFMRLANPGDFVTASAEILRQTRSLLFIRGECRVDREAILAGDAMVKRTGQAHAAAGA